MKEIIKEGRLPATRTVYETICKKCGTIFRCEDSDFSFFPVHGIAYGPETKCPFCGTMISYGCFEAKEVLLWEVLSYNYGGITIEAKEVKKIDPSQISEIAEALKRECNQGIIVNSNQDVIKNYE
jgi:hypothetical protein